MAKRKSKKRDKSKITKDKIVDSVEKTEEIVSENNVGVESTENAEGTENAADYNRIESTGDGTGNVRIELDHVVEHKGNYYRGVQVVSRKLAKKLLELDTQWV
jgi:hypothetical protein